MTHTLLLKLKGPMQSWGDSSRFKDRHTGNVPTKSGVLGLIAAAQGRRRSDPIEDLARLTFAVRIDQPGTLLRDFQTGEALPKNGGNNLVTRYYLSDAVFIAGIESEDFSLLKGLEKNLTHPRFPLYLGRRSCPANPDLVIGIHEGSAAEVLRTLPWQAPDYHRKARATRVDLPIYRDALPGETGEHKRDVPVSFSQENREYSWRIVVQDAEGAQLANPHGTKIDDPFFEAVISA